jgi:hypothetical protein
MLQTVTSPSQLDISCPRLDVPARTALFIKAVNYSTAVWRVYGKERRPSAIGKFTG